MSSVACLFLVFSFLSALLVIFLSHVLILDKEGQVVSPLQAKNTLRAASSSHYLEQLSSYASSFNSTTTDFTLSHLRFSRPVQPIKIAYMVTITEECKGDWIDSALVLRHSIHLTSIRGNPKSVYDYHMVAVVYDRAEKSCAQFLHHAGYEVLVKPSPVAADEIVDGYLKRKLSKSGTKDFMPLYMYELTEYPIVVSLNLDSLVIKPLDDLLDAILYHPSSSIGYSARQRIYLEFPKTPLPNNIQALLTKDWPQVIPGRKAIVRPGFMVVKPNLDIFRLMVDVIRHGDYVEGYSRDNGWGGLGNGGITGSTGASGLMAYVYEAILYDTVAEINQCKYNHVGMDVFYRGPPSFKRNHPKAGHCRNDQTYCEDCMTTSLQNIYSVQYGMCPKPWHCIAEGITSRSGDKTAIPDNQVDLAHCLQLMGIWHGVRTDFETKLYNLTAGEKIRSGQSGTFKKNVFSGHCQAYGEGGYLKIAGSVRTMQRIPDLYK